VAGVRVVGWPQQYCHSVCFRQLVGYLLRVLLGAVHSMFIVVVPSPACVASLRVTALCAGQQAGLRCAGMITMCCTTCRPTCTTYSQHQQQQKPQQHKAGARHSACWWVLSAYRPVTSSEQLGLHAINQQELNV
jgi:hypothetical protein